MDDLAKACQSIAFLASIKNEKLDKDQIIAISKILLSEISFSDINNACGYFAKRFRGMPDISDFFNLVCPAKSIDVLVEHEISELLQLVSSGVYKKEIFSDNQNDLLSVWSWSSLMAIKSSDLEKIRSSMSWYLKAKLSSDGKTKIKLSSEAFIEYRNKNETKSIS